MSIAFTLSGDPAPLFPLTYKEGQNTSIPLFRDVRILGNETTISLQSLVVLFPTNMEAPEVNFSTPVSGITYVVNRLYFTGTMSEANAIMSDLSLTMSIYENRDLSVQIAISSPEFAIPRYCFNTFYGTRNNTAPYIDNVKLETTYDGSLNTYQKMDATVWNAFIDTRDSFYNPSDPGIQQACVSCNSVQVFANKEPAVCSSFANAKAGTFSFRGDVYKVPRCTVWVTDIDPNGLNPLTSERYQLDMIFTPKQTRLQQFVSWSKSPSGILSWIGTILSVLWLRKNISNGSKTSSLITHLMCSRYRIAIWRYGYINRHGKKKSTDIIPFVSSVNVSFVRYVESMYDPKLSPSINANTTMTSLLKKNVVLPYTGVWKVVMYCFKCKYYINSSNGNVAVFPEIDIADVS